METNEMIISAKMNEKENEKVKAFINIQIGDYQLKGFKLFENDKKELKMLMPTISSKNEDGEYVNKKIINLNAELGNRSELYSALEDMITNVYNEMKTNNVNTINKTVEAKDFTQGEINISPYIVSQSKIKNDIYQLKSNNKLFIGAFQVNDIALVYNKTKNDYNLIIPSYKIKSSEKEENKTFIVPTTKEAYADIKNKIVNTYKEKKAEYKNKMNETANAKYQKSNLEMGQEEQEEAKAVQKM